MVELVQEFQRLHPRTEVRATYGSSGNLFAQLSNKAPFHIFFSADIEYSIVLTDLYPKLIQGGVILSWAVDRGATEALRDFVTGDQGREVLERHGFLLPGE